MWPGSRPSNVSVGADFNICRRVVIMGIDKFDTDNDSYYWSSVNALNNLGHHVTVISNRGMSLRAAHQINYPHLCIGTWIPRTILGFFRSTMYMLRSVYTAVWVTQSCRNTIPEMEPTLVITDASAVAIPILHKVGGFQVICLEYFRELLAEFQPYNPARSVIERFLCPFRRMCFSRAQLILVPCKSARQLLDINEEDERVNVLYPPAEGESSTVRYEMEHLNPHRSPIFGSHNYIRGRSQFQVHPIEFQVRSHFIFVAVGAYEPHCNFNVIIDAFSMLVLRHEFVHQQRLRLEIVGSCSTDEHYDYREELSEQIAHLAVGLSSRIILHTNVDFEQRCIIYRRSCSVLNANVRDLYVPSIIEALFFARIVITGESKFSSEVIQNAVTGVVVHVPTDMEEFAIEFTNAIYRMLHSEGPTYKFIAMAASYEYDDVHSFSNFESRLQQYILSITNRGDPDLE